VSAVPQPRPDEPLYLTVKSDLSLFLGKCRVDVQQERIGVGAQFGHDKRHAVLH